MLALLLLLLFVFVRLRSQIVPTPMPSTFTFNFSSLVLPLSFFLPIRCSMEVEAAVCARHKMPYGEGKRNEEDNTRKRRRKWKEKCTFYYCVCRVPYLVGLALAQNTRCAQPK